MALEHWILDEHGNPVIEPDLIKWAEWFGGPARVLAQEDIGGCLVSTVFLGMDHNWGAGLPVLWETMIFGSVDNRFSDFQQRYTSREEALEGHKQAVRMVLDDPAMAQLLSMCQEKLSPPAS